MGAIKTYFKDFGVLRETGKGYWGLQAINILDGTFEFAFGMVITIFLSKNIGFTDVEAGYALTIIGVISSITFLFIGPLVDRLGLKKTIFYGLMGMLVFRSALAYCAFYPGIPYRALTTLAMYFLSGIPISMIAISYRVGNRTFSTEKSRKAAFNIWYVAMNIGALFGGALVDYVNNGLKLPNHWIILFGIGTTILSILVAVLTIRTNKQFEAVPERHIIRKKLKGFGGVLLAVAIALCVNETLFENDTTRVIGKETRIIRVRHSLSLAETYIKFVLRARESFLFVKSCFSAVLSQIARMGCAIKKYFLLVVTFCILQTKRIFSHALLFRSWHFIAFVLRVLKELTFAVFTAFKDILSILLKAGKDILAVFWKLCIAILLIFGKTIKTLGNLPNFQEFMLAFAICICVKETSFEHYWKGGIPETRIVYAKKSLIEIFARIYAKVGEGWQYLKRVVIAPSFSRMIAAITLLMGVRAIFLYTGLMMPKYWYRVIGDAANIGWINNVNPFIIILGVFFLIPIIKNWNTYKMLAWGALLGGTSLLPLALPWHFVSSDIVSAYYAMAITSMAILALGEMFWSPRLEEYITSVAPEGQIGIYSAFASLPWFIGKTLTGAVSGLMLMRWCPEFIVQHGTNVPLQTVLTTQSLPYWQTPEAMWFILAIPAVVGPIIMLLMKDWFLEVAKQKV